MTRVGHASLDLERSVAKATAFQSSKKLALIQRFLDSNPGGDNLSPAVTERATSTCLRQAARNSHRPLQGRLSHQVRSGERTIHMIAGRSSRLARIASAVNWTLSKAG